MTKWNMKEAFLIILAISIGVYPSLSFITYLLGEILPELLNILFLNTELPPLSILIFLNEFKSLGIFKHLSFITVLYLILLLLYYSFIATPTINAKKNEVDGDTHGDGAWSSNDELKERYIEFEFEKIVDLSDKPEYKSGWLIGYNPTTNKHYIDPTILSALTIAPARRNKTTAISIPELSYNLMTGASVFVTDPKGEMLGYTKAILDSLNYKVKVFNLKEPKYSSKYNLLGTVNDFYDKYNDALTNNDLYEANEYLSKCQRSASQLAQKMMLAAKSQNTGNDNPFFYESSIGALTSAILLVTQFAPKEKRHFPSVIRLINDIVRNSSESNKLRDILMATYKGKTENIASVVAGASGSVTDKELLNNIFSSLSTSLLKYQDQSLLQVFNYAGSNNLQATIETKTATFLIFPDDNPAVSAIASLLIVQTVDGLSDIADKTLNNENHLLNGKLSRQYRFILEEIGNVSKIDSFDKYLSLYQGKNITFALTFQDYSQMKKLYGTDADTIIKNADLKRYLGFSGDDVELAERVSKALGNITVKNKSMTSDISSDRSLLSSNAKTVTTQLIERPLMTPEAILQSKETIVIKSPFKPIKTPFIPFYMDSFKLKFSRSSYQGEMNKFSNINTFTLEDLEDQLEISEKAKLDKEKNLKEKSKVALLEKYSKDLGRSFSLDNLPNLNAITSQYKVKLPDVDLSKIEKEYSLTFKEEIKQKIKRT